jgi:hypothetical protein
MPTSQPNDDLEFSPYFAGMEGKTDEQALALEQRIEALPEPTKDFIFSDATDRAIGALIETEHLEHRYGIALAKIVFAVVLGDIPLASVGQLLERLDIAPDVAQRIAKGISALTQPALTVKAPTIKEIPPLSRTVGGIIDLRKKTE